VTRRAIVAGKCVKFCRVTTKARILARVSPPVEFRTVRLAKGAKVMFEERIREFPDWLLGHTMKLGAATRRHEHVDGSARPHEAPLFHGCGREFLA